MVSMVDFSRIASTDDAWLLYMLCQLGLLDSITSRFCLTLHPSWIPPTMGGEPPHPHEKGWRHPRFPGQGHPPCLPAFIGATVDQIAPRHSKLATSRSPCIR